MENCVIIFRVDSSNTIGYGHLYRCMSLASKIKKNNKIYFISNKFKGNINSKIISNGYKLIENNISNYQKINKKKYEKLDSDKVIYEIKRFKKKNKHIILIKDSYDLGLNWEKKIYNYVNKLIVIEDIPKDKHYCDILIDQTYGRKKIDYDNLLKLQTKLLLGSKFTMIRNEFDISKKIITKFRNKIRKIKNITITMGGSDYYNVSLLILKEINKYSLDKSYKFTLIIGKNNKHKNILYKYIKLNKLIIKFSIDPKNIYKIFLNTHIAITAGGSTLWQFFSFGVPVIVYKTVKNQNQIINNLKKKKLIYYGGYRNNISKNFKKMILISNNLKKIKILSNKLLNEFDAKGTSRIYKNI